MSENKINTGYIYTIRFKDDDKFIYVGSTTNLKRRWLDHKNKATLSKFKHYLLYNYMSVYGHDKFYIQVHETLNFNVKDDLLKREKEVIKQIGTLNNYKPNEINETLKIKDDQGVYNELNHKRDERKSFYNVLYCFEGNLSYFSDRWCYSRVFAFKMYWSFVKSKFKTYQYFLENN